MTDKLGVKSRIEGCCKTENCNEIFNKSFENLMKTLAFCKKCSLKNQQEKSKQVCLEKYGFAYPMQNEKIKDKIKETCLEMRVGVML